MLRRIAVLRLGASDRIVPLGTVLLLVLLQVCVPAPAQKAAAATDVADPLSQAERAAEGVGQAYRALLKQVRESRSVALRDVASLCFWSERMMQAEMWASSIRAKQSPVGVDKAETAARALNAAFDAHVARLEQVAQAAKDGASGGKDDPVVASAAESLVLLAEQQRAALLEARQAEEEREMDLVLPDASEAQPLVTSPRELFVNIDAQGQYHVTGKLVDLDGLRSILKAAWVNNPGRVTVVIRADRKAPFRAVLAVIEACKKADIRDYRVTTRDGTSDD